jgi:predicted MPP superfamily phosphohydrolase
VAAGLGWGLYEAQWVRFRLLDVPIPGLPEALDGFRILHLSDLHLGTLSQNARALEKAVAWDEARDVDVLALTGDLISRNRGEAQLERALGRLKPRYGGFAVLGNHEVDESRDPFSEPVGLAGLARRGAVLLEDSSRTFAVDGVAVQVVGAAPSSRRSPPTELTDPDADFRLLLLRGLMLGGDFVHLGHVVLGGAHAVDEFAIIGEQQQTGGVLV